MKKSKSKSVANHLRAYADWLEEQEFDTRKEAAKTFNKWMDDLRTQDAFGTEGQ